MSEEGFWCGFKRKKVVMSIIALCCLSLVVWTIVITSGTPEDMLAANNGTNTTNLTKLDVCTYNASEQIDQVKLYLFNDGGSNISRKNLLERTQDKVAPLCKCYCKLNITEEQLLEAVRLLKLNELPQQIVATPRKPDRSATLTAVQTPRKAVGLAPYVSGYSAGPSSNSESRSAVAQPAAGSMSNMASDEDVMTFAGGGLS